MDTNCTPYLRMCMVTYTHTITCTNPFSGAANHTWKLVLSTSYCNCKTGCFKCKHYIFWAVRCFYNKSLFLYFSLLTLVFPLLLFHFFLVIDCKESWVARNLCNLLFDMHLWDMLFFFFFFNCYLAAPWPTLGHYRGDSLTHPMLITAFYIFNPKVTGSLVTRLGP